MSKQLADSEYLEVISPRTEAIMNSVRGNIGDLHPIDKFYLLSNIIGECTNLKDESFVQAATGTEDDKHV